MFQDEGSSSVTSSSSPLQYFSKMPISPTSSLGAPYCAAPRIRELKSDERGLYLIHLLLNCATSVAAGALDKANACLEHISLLASPDGDAMQRVAAHFTEALARRVLRSWPGLYRALRAPAPLPDTLLARRHFFDLCPFLMLAYLVTNQAILEAMEGERVVHVVDLGGISTAADNPVQWLAFLQALRNRPDGPPHLRFTAVHEHKELLDHTGTRLSEEAERLDIPFQFNAVVSRLEDLDVERLHVRTGEALAISSILQLHCLLGPDDNGSPGNRRSPTPNATKKSSAAQFLRIAQMSQGTLGQLLEKDTRSSRSPVSVSSSPPQSQKTASFLASLWGLSPKVMVVTEQESNHNAPTLSERFTEALNFYAALFDCLESTVPRASVERARVEKMLLGEEIKNIIACEGSERRERHERLDRWVQRLELAGFGRVPLSYYGLLQARRLLQSYGRQGYGVKEESGCSLICWQDRPIFSVSAWSCRRYM